MLRIALLATGIFCCVTTSAAAGTATGIRVLVEDDPRYGKHYNLDVRYEGAQGEANDVTVTITGEQVVIEDAGAAIDANGHCSATAPNRVVCSSSGDGLRWTRIELADEGDQARVETEKENGLVRLRGGRGDDTLQGSRLYESLFGGAGDDLVDGGAGGDTIDGGGGRDELRAGEPLGPFAEFDFIEDGDSDRNPDADTIVGQPDRTTLSYRSRKRPVRVDLAAGAAGSGGEGDRISGITLLEGGRAADVLLGTDGDDFIRGNRGADIIRARAGDDGVRGQSGRDRVFGGAGDDLFGEDSDNARDLHGCGRGYDFVALSDARDRLRGSCEDGAWTTSPDAPPDLLNRITVEPAIGRRDVRFRSTCREAVKCKGRIRLVTPEERELLGQGRFEFRRRGHGDPATAKRYDIVATLNERGRERLRGGGYVRVVVRSRYDCMGCLNPPPPVNSGFTTFMKR